MRGLNYIGALALLVLCGCTTGRSMTLSEGSQGKLIACGGIQHAMADCCLTDYDVIDERDEAHP